MNGQIQGYGLSVPDDGGGDRLAEAQIPQNGAEGLPVRNFPAAQVDENIAGLQAVQLGIVPEGPGHPQTLGQMPVLLVQRLHLLPDLTAAGGADPQ